ncbi:hypothetical protein [Salana multivorans]
MRTVETAQTFLTAVEVDALVGDYLAGMGVKALAERYGIHRATVFSHLRRRNVPSRRPGLGVEEKAEAVRLARAGVSMRAIGRRMGVDRKAVRVSLVEAGLIVDDPSERPLSSQTIGAFADARYPSTSMRFRCMRYPLSSSRSRSWGRT